MKRLYFSLPLPALGLNAKDAINNMDMRFALALNNLVPKQHYLELRKGYKLFVPFQARPSFLAAYEYGLNNCLICALQGDIYRINEDATQIKLNETRFNYDAWQSVNYKGRMFLSNGQDEVQVFDGETLQRADFSAAENYQSSFASSKLSSGVLHANRLFFIEKNSLVFWYAKNAGQIAGEFEPFDLSQIAKFGGKLVAAVNLSPLAQEGLVGFLTSNGEFIVYGGDNPADLNSWALKARIKLPRPLGPNCFEEFHGEIAYLSQEGYFLLSQLMATAATNKAVAINDKINPLLRQYSQIFDNEGWQIKHFEKEALLIINIPARGGSVQHVLNSESGAWCSFSGIDAQSFCSLKDNFYFAGTAKNGQNGIFIFADIFNDAGEQIAWEWKTPYTNFNNPLVKALLESNVLLKASSNFVFDLTASVDFVPEVNIYRGGSREEAPQWDLALWDIAKWAAEAKARKLRILTKAPCGQYYSLGLAALGYNQPLQIIGMDVFYEQGSNLI